MSILSKSKQFIFIVLSLFFVVALYFITPTFFPSTFKNIISVEGSIKSTSTESVITEPKFVVTHIKTPTSVKGIYMSACVAATPSFREKLVKIANYLSIYLVPKTP